LFWWPVHEVAIASTGPGGGKREKKGMFSSSSLTVFAYAGVATPRLFGWSGWEKGKKGEKGEETIKAP